MIWFTADWHFFHERVLEYHPKRKEIFGTNMKEVTEKMILKWNSRIDKHDTVYILGDLAFGSTEEKRMFSWEHKEKGSIMLHGHCHGSIDTFNNADYPESVRIDVGIDSEFANYEFVSLNRLATYLHKIYKELKHA